MFFMCVCMLCLSCKHWRTRTAVTVSSEHVYVAFDFLISMLCPRPTTTATTTISLALSVLCRLLPRLFVCTVAAEESRRLYKCSLCDSLVRMRLQSDKHKTSGWTQHLLPWGRWTEPAGPQENPWWQRKRRAKWEEGQRSANRQLEFAKTNWYRSADNKIKSAEIWLKNCCFSRYRGLSLFFSLGVQHPQQGWAI